MNIKSMLNDTGSPVAYYASLKPFLGTVNATLLFCQILYWTGKGQDPNGWIYKTSKELQGETGLTKDQQETARKSLRVLGIVEEKCKRTPPIVHFRIRGEVLQQKWEEYLIKRGDSPQLKEHEYLQMNAVNTPQQMTDNPAYITESTHETTQKSTSKMVDQSRYSFDEEEKEHESKLKEGRSQVSDWQALGKILKERKPS